MKVTGFSFIKNAIKYDYPIEEAIRSVLPLCDDFVVAVGKSEDATLDLIRQIDPQKIKIIETEWAEDLREGGQVLALETDKAFAAISKDCDWAFYIQGDEVVHEKYLDAIYQAMQKTKDAKHIDALLFHYLHFYGSYDYVGTSSSWYKREIRVVKNNPSIYSYKDAQGFRKGANEKLNAHPIEAFVHHYGWVKAPEVMQRKQEHFNKYWHDDQWIDQNILKADTFDYEKHIQELRLFTGTHPAVMQKRIAAQNWKFDFDLSLNRKTIKERSKDFLYRYFGLDLGHQNYRITKL